MALSTNDKLSAVNAAAVRHALKLRAAAQHDGENVTLEGALEASESLVNSKARYVTREGEIVRVASENPRPVGPDCQIPECEHLRIPALERQRHKLDVIMAVILAVGLALTMVATVAAFVWFVYLVAS